GLVGTAQGVGNLEAIDAGDTDDVARFGALHRYPLEAVVAHHLQDTGAAALALGVDHHDVVVALEGAAADAANADHTHVAVVVEGADLHLEGAVGVHRGRRDLVDDHLEQGRHVLFERIHLEPGDTVEGGGVDDGEVELFVGGAEAVEQVEHLVDDPVGAG